MAALPLRQCVVPAMECMSWHGCHPVPQTCKQDLASVESGVVTTSMRGSCNYGRNFFILLDGCFFTVDFERKSVQLLSVTSIPKIDGQVLLMEAITWNDFHGPKLHTRYL